MSAILNAEVQPVIGSFEPAVEVPDATDLELIGRIPPEVTGTLFRNGPARFDAGGFVAAHPFDGDGLVSKFVIADGAVTFRSRYVRTPKFLREEAGAGSAIRGVFTQAAVRGRNIGRFPADSANTHAVMHGGRLLALSDSGNPWEIDPDDLSTIGQCTFEGGLPRSSRFSPHPKVDPLTGDLFNFGLDIAPHGLNVPAVLRCYRVDPSGRLHRAGVVPLDHVLVQHDFAITEHYLVFVLSPLTVAPVKGALALLGIGDFGGAADYRPEQGMKIVLVPRAGGPNRVIECDPLVYVHVDNAYEDGTDVVVDLVRYDSFDFLSEGLRSFRTVGNPVFGNPARLRISAAGRVGVETRDDLASVEFPTHDERRTGHRHRFTYVVQASEAGSAILKIDRSDDSVTSHVFEADEVPGEPVFVPRMSSASEDDGWLLTVTYLPKEHRTALVILDARTLEAPPVAVAKVEGHFFPGFHGGFTAGRVS